MSHSYFDSVIKYTLWKADTTVSAVSLCQTMLYVHGCMYVFLWHKSKAIEPWVIIKNAVVLKPR